MSKSQGPGLLWQLLEFFGMTWPGQKILDSTEKQLGPLCKACMNPTTWIEQQQMWRCPNHPQAQLYQSDDEQHQVHMNHNHK